MNLIKIILLGNTGVGKSKICSSYFKKNYHDNATIGVDFFFKDIKINDTTYRVHIWDTAGQERFKSIVRSYFRNSNASIIVFDQNKKKTIEEINNWITELGSNQQNNNIFLVGNKIDILDKKNSEINENDINNLINNNSSIKNYYKISAETTENLVDTLDDIIKKTIILNHYDKFYDISINNLENISTDKINYIYYKNIEKKQVKNSSCC